MTEHSGMGPIDFTVDTDNLYLEEIFTDFKAGNIRKLTPVDLEGEEDIERDVLFFGQTRMMTQNGPI